ncbi:MAG: hypothetical protein ACYSWR_00920 [Planctomycetota bacterium]
MLYGKSQLNGKCPIILAAIIFGGVVGFLDFAAFASEGSGEGRVIEFGWDTPTIPWLCDNVAIAECTPFHGIILDLAQREGQGSLSWIAWAANAIPFEVQQNAEEDIALLNDANFTRLRENSFFRLNSSGWSEPPDFFDADFNTVVSNITFMASAVYQTALAGIAFDPEDYFANCWHYPSRKYSATKTFGQYQVQVRQRGQEVAAAIKTACPGRDFVLLFTFANSLPYISTQWWGHPLSEDSYGLLPAFVDGLLDEACGQIRVIDGIESAYPNKTMAEFQGSVSNYQNGATLSADPSRYLSCVGIGFGTWMDYRSDTFGWYTDPNEFNLNHFTPETFNQAMDISTDLAEFSWVYTQIPDWYHWYLETVPEAYFNALADVTGLPPATPCTELLACLLRAKDPFPADAAQNVHPKVVLSWEAGIKAASHDVYFGADANAVGDANMSETLGVYVGQQDACEYAPTIFLELGQTYYWRIDEVNDVNIWQGEVWSFTVVDDDGKAGNPSPANGATNVPGDTILSWSPGLVAGSHDVYLGTDWDDVNDANNYSTEYKGSQILEANTYDPCGLLELEKTYYWRIDEVNPGYADSKGDVWSFTTVNYAVVDDMEAYTGTWEGQGDHPLDEGWTGYFANGTGSLLYLQTSTPVRDEQSMEYWYDNTWDGSLRYCSESKSLDLNPTDWAGSGAKILSLWFYGEPNNDADDTEQMYVGLEDDAGLYAELRYGDNEDEDMNDIKIADWQEWNIPLPYFSDSNFAAEANDVNLTDVNTLFIGFGIRGGLVAGGVGTVYFDDIRLYSPRCVPELGPYADLSGNCIVDFADIEALAEDWLYVGLSAADLYEDNVVNLKDFAVLADMWLKEQLWPESVE